MLRVHKHAENQWNFTDSAHEFTSVDKHVQNFSLWKTADILSLQALFEFLFSSRI